MCVGGRGGGRGRGGEEEGEEEGERVWGGTSLGRMECACIVNKLVTSTTVSEEVQRSKYKVCNVKWLHLTWLS